MRPILSDGLFAALAVFSCKCRENILGEEEKRGKSVWGGSEEECEAGRKKKPCIWQTSLSGPSKLGPGNLSHILKNGPGTLAHPGDMPLGLLTTLRFVTDHPLNAGRRFDALGRFTRWQIGSRLLPGSAVAVPFVNQSRLLITPGMTGATGNIYTGLHEFEDMGFLLHVLRKEDLFVDIGANVGSYTVLAGAAIGARCLSAEPLPTTYEHLLDNIYLNRMPERVAALNIGLGREEGMLRFSSGLDTMNHVLTEDEAGMPATEVPVRRLDAIVGDAEPAVVKIDVEGFETEVILGAAATLARPSLLAVIMELNGSGRRYGYDEAAIHQTMLDHGFKTYSYRPFTRELAPIGSTNADAGNTLYLKDVDQVTERVRSAPAFHSRGKQV